MKHSIYIKRDGDDVVVYMTALIISAAWGILNIWAYHKEGSSMVKMYVGISKFMLMGLTFSLLVRQGVIA